MDIEKVLSVLVDEVADYQVPVVDLIAVQTRDPFKVLVATILSARTKDEVTAVASERLFAKASTPADLAELSEGELQKLIFPVGFYKNKARYLAALPEKIALFDSQVPQTMEELLTLPGVGRKTANLVLAQAFAIPAICVDTHVHRIMNIWGYVDTDTPLQTEMALREKLPEKFWIPVNSLLVSFGQGTCRPVGPHCDRCVLEKQCPKIGVIPRKTKKKKSADENVVRLVSWNVNGLRAVYKKGFLKSLQEMAPDVIGLQEIKAMVEQLPPDLQKLKGYHGYFYSAERKGYSGVAVYSIKEPKRIIKGIGDDRFDSEGRVLTLEFADYYFVNCYFPNSKNDLSRLDFKHDFNVLLQKFAEELAREKSVVVCGDFNVAHKEIDLANPRQNVKNAGFTPEERAWMDDFTGAGWVDSFRVKHTGPDNYSWWSYRSRARERNVGWRIDYFCVDAGSRKKIRDAGIYPEIFGSDHCPVMLDFRL